MNIELRKDNFEHFVLLSVGSFFLILKRLIRHAIDHTVIEVASEVMQVSIEYPAWFSMARA